MPSDNHLSNESNLSIMTPPVCGVTADKGAGLRHAAAGELLLRLAQARAIRLGHHARVQRSDLCSSQIISYRPPFLFFLCLADRSVNVSNVSPPKHLGSIPIFGVTVKIEPNERSFPISDFRFLFCFFPVHFMRLRRHLKRDILYGWSIEGRRTKRQPASDGWCQSSPPSP